MHIHAGALEAELGRDIEKLRTLQEAGGELLMDEDDWGVEDEEEEDEDDEEGAEEDGEGEENSDDEAMLVDWPEEPEPTDWSALEADGWLDMDAILDQAEGTGEEELDVLLRALEGMPEDEEEED